MGANFFGQTLSHFSLLSGDPRREPGVTGRI
jgi:hypothetical protein